jgi:LAS superfamily LD-carboxypeptidase LdcB
MAAKKKTPAAAGATLYPVLPIIKPTDLTGQQNGYLTANILRTIQKPSGQLEKHAATAWNCLQLAAYFNGLTLNQVGAYRTYDRQLAMFNDRYSIKDYGRKPQVIRIWQGRKYYLKPGKAPSATPGNSDHGLGLAIDCGELLRRLSVVGVAFRRRLHDVRGPALRFHLGGRRPQEPQL